MIDTTSIAAFKEAFRQELSEMLGSTGRTLKPAKPPREGEAPVAADTEGARRTRAEASAGVILAKMEQGTQGNQRDSSQTLRALEAELKDLDAHTELLRLAAVQGDQESATALADIPEQRAALVRKMQAIPVTHAVSAHGKGTDQMGRLLHGRRADEMAHDGAPPDPVALDGNKHGLPGTGAVGYETVGRDASNTSGAFTSNQGMLSAVNEAFAQADQVSRYAERTGSTLADERLVTKVAGTGEGLGYNLEVQGMAAQESGSPLQADEMQKRFENIKRTDGLENAKVVLDPAFVDGRRAGWNLQTAFATDETPDGVSQSDDVGDSLLLKKHELKQAEAQEKALREEIAGLEAERQAMSAQLDEAERLIVVAQKAVADEQAKAQALQQKADDESAPLKALPDDLPDGEELLAAIGALDGSENAGAITALKEKLDELSDACYEPPEDMFGLPEAKATHDKVIELCAAATRALDARIEQLEASRLVGVQAGLLRDREATRDAQQLQLGQDEEYTKIVAGLAGAKEALPHVQSTLRSKRQAVADAQGDDAGGEDDEAGSAAAQAGYNPVTGLYEAAKRPAKPANLKGVDDDYESLTAHHLYPWNKLRTDLNNALAKGDAGALKKLFQFGMMDVDASFWTELEKPAATRSYAFTSAVNVAAQKICWSPKNVFMGVKGEKREGDPGEEVDTNYSKTGLPTPAAALAELLERGGGGFGDQPDDPVAARAALEESARTRLEKEAGKGETVTDEMITAAVTEQMVAAEVKKRISTAKLSEMLLKNSRDAVDNEAQAYDPSDWEDVGGGKKSLRAQRAAPAELDVTFRWEVASWKSLQDAAENLPLRALEREALTEPVSDLIAQIKAADISAAAWTSAYETPPQDGEATAQRQALEVLAAQALKDLEAAIAGADAVIALREAQPLHRYMRDCRTGSGVRRDQILEAMKPA